MPTPTTATARMLPLGLWRSDAARSVVTFSLAHLRLQVFQSHFDDVEAQLDVSPDGAAALRGAVRAGSIAAKDTRLAALLASPSLFDSVRFPELRFESSAIRRAGEMVEVDGWLAIKTTRLRVTALGTVVDRDPDDADRIWLELETALDRRQFGLLWNARLPGGGLALGHEVRVRARLALVRA